MSSIRRRKGQTIWKMEYKDQHGVIHKDVSTGCRDKRSAGALANMIERDAERIRAGVAPENALLTGKYLGLEQKGVRAGKEWPEAVEAYFLDQERLGRAKSGIQEGQSRLKKAHEWGKWKLVGEVEAVQVGEYLRHLAAEGKAARSQNHARKHLRLFLAFCLTQGWVTENVAEGSKAVPLTRSTRRHLRRALTVQELERLLGKTREFEDQDKRWRKYGEGRRSTLYEVAAYAGYRRSELLRLLKEDCTPTVQKPRWHVAAERTKNGLEVLPMTPECARAIAGAWERLSVGEPLCTSAPNMNTWRGDLKRAGIPYRDARGQVADFHALRYTFCSFLAKQYPIEVVSKLMRHSSIQLTADVYLELAPDKEGDGEWVLAPLLPGKPEEHRQAEEEQGLEERTVRVHQPEENDRRRGRWRVWNGLSRPGNASGSPPCNPPGPGPGLKGFGLKATFSKSLFP